MKKLLSKRSEEIFDDFSNAYEEIALMNVFCHDNVLKLVRVIQPPTSLPWLVLEYMKHGSLFKLMELKQDDVEWVSVKLNKSSLRIS